MSRTQKKVIHTLLQLHTTDNLKMKFTLYSPNIHLCPLLSTEGKKAVNSVCYILWQKLEIQSIMIYMQTAFSTAYTISTAWKSKSYYFSMNELWESGKGGNESLNRGLTQEDQRLYFYWPSLHCVLHLKNISN